MSTNIEIQTRNGYGTVLAAVLNLPPSFDETTTYPAIVVSHPGGGVKEQTAGLYARALAEAGFVTIAYDASFQGASTGSPRQLENPHIRTEDVSAVVDHLTTLPYVDDERIGAMGICAGAGYTVNAAIGDPRIKAVGTVSMVNIGQMFRNGWDGSVKDAEAAPVLGRAAAARTADAAGRGDGDPFPLAPMNREDAPNPELEEAWEYYHTPRCEHPNAPGWMTTRSLSQIIPYDAFHKAEAFLTQPLLLIVGAEAGSRWMSDDLYERAASTDKTRHVVQDANHMSLYDGERETTEALSRLAPFFAAKL
ncbi:alpha/beta hydrolase [Actinomadura flavalba]|uniref:alpha/beta hydrolase n=1 Tax=Actinomadura flavalba TaxID=1120938 RepID=UPI0003AB3C8E|nr:alpha/beta hydrolase [Actinomadura flavalba]